VSGSSASGITRTCCLLRDEERRAHDAPPQPHLLRGEEQSVVGPQVCLCVVLLQLLQAIPLSEREFFIDNLLVRIKFIIEMIWWTGLAPWEFEVPFPGSLTFVKSGFHMCWPWERMEQSQNVDNAGLFFFFTLVTGPRRYLSLAA